MASFDSDESLTGNRVGAARVLARWGYSLVDTVVVVVEENNSSSPLQGLSGKSGSPSIRPSGSHSDPTLLKSSPSTAKAYLEILGDEKYSDGVISKTGINLAQGTTIEFEFKMEIDQNIHQRLWLCLWDFDPATLSTEQRAEFPVPETRRASPIPPGTWTKATCPTSAYL